MGTTTLLILLGGRPKLIVVLCEKKDQKNEMTNMLLSCAIEMRLKTCNSWPYENDLSR